MSIRLEANSTPAPTEVAYNAALGVLNIFIRDRKGEAPHSGSLRSWTPFDTTFDYDSGGRVKSIEVMIPPLRSRLAKLSTPASSPGYVDLYVTSDSASTSEEIFYDPRRGTLLVSLADIKDAPLYRIADTLLVQVRGDQLVSVWVLGVDLVVGL